MKSRKILAIIASFTATSPLARAQWLVTPANATFSNGANWNGGTVNGNFSGASTITTLSIGSGQATNLAFANAATAAYTIGLTPNAGSFALSSGGSVNMTSAVTNSQIINSALLHASRTNGINHTLTASGINGSSLTFAGNITGNISTAGISYRADLKGTGLGVVNGIISDGTNGATPGNTMITKTGGAAQNGTWELNGANTYSGGTEFSGASGTLVLGNKAALGTGALRIISGSGTLRANDNLIGENAVANTINYVSANATATTTTASITFTASSTTATLVSGTAPAVGDMITAGALNNVPVYARITGVSGSTLTLSTPAAVSGTVTTTTSPFSNGGGGTTTIGGSKHIEFSGIQNLTTAWSNGAAATQIFNITNSATTTFSGVLQQQAGSASVTKTGAGTLVLSNANTYTGTTVVSQGVVSVSSLANGGVASNIGASSNITSNLLLDGGTLRYTGAGSNTDRRFDLRVSSIIDASGSGALKFNAGSGFNNGATGTASARTLILTGSNTDDNTILPNIVDSGSGANITSISKTGAGKWILGGASNTYSGTTAVTSGTLLVNGTNSGIGAISVASGATLGGTGTLAGATTIGSNGIHSAGAVATGGANGVGKQTFGSGVSYETGSIFEWNLADVPSESGRGTSYDAVNSASLGATTGAIFRVVLNGNQDFTAGFWDIDRTWSDIFKTGDIGSNLGIASIFSGTVQYYNGGGGTVASISAPTAQGAFTFTGTDLKWSAVPEPTCALAGLLIGAGLLRRRRA